MDEEDAGSINGERKDEAVAIRDPGAIWCDGAVLMSDGTIMEHEFYSKPLVSLIRRKIRVEREEDDEGGTAFVSSRELSLFVTGRCRRRAAGFSIYWHSHSDLIFVLTGVTYCAQIYVECGRMAPDGTMEMLIEPRVLLVRARDPNGGISHVSWSKTPGIWPKDVGIKLVKISSNAPAARQPTPVMPNVGMIGFPCVRLFGEPTNIDIGAYVPLVVGDREQYTDERLRLDCETSIFLERASAVYLRLLAIERELETSLGRRREVLMRCVELAARKRLLLVDGTPIGNMFASEVCLCGLGEDSYANEIVGVLWRRRDTKSGAVFNLHNVALANGTQLALILRRIQEYSAYLPPVERRLDMTDPLTSAARDFYAAEVDVGVSVVSVAADVLRAFSLRGLVSDGVKVVEKLGVPMTGPVERDDVIRVLQL
ncbi:M88 protein [Murid betaherpesvirus 1]|nr:M88 protein [Murid betaherpesvirus 1]